MPITIQSFGFEYQAPPTEAVWVADVRDIDPSVYGSLGDRDGLDPELSALILASPTAQAWVRKYEIDVMRELVDGDLVAVGCSEGRHRSVAIAEAFALSSRVAGIEVIVEHLDLDRQRDTTDTMDAMNVTPISSARTWYAIKNATAQVAEIFIDDQIGEDYWTGGGVTSKTFITDLQAVKAPEIHLHLNSPGGSVFDGVAIYNALVRHPAKVTTYIDGLAASIASVIALAGDRVIMADNALFMIHNPAGAVQGTADDMRKMAEVLDRIRETALVGTYAKRSNLSTEELVAAIDAETWYSAEEALAAGFVDEIAQGLRIAAHFDLSKYGYRHVPKIANLVGVEEIEGAIAEGDFVAWDNNGIQRGRIEHVMTNGILGVPDSEYSLEASPDNPAGLIRIWQQGASGTWQETEVLVGSRFDSLTKIAPLNAGLQDSDTAGAVDVGHSIGAIETPATPEAYIPGIGFHRFTSNQKNKE